jgi:hypothetical protein
MFFFVIFYLLIILTCIVCSILNILNKNVYSSIIFIVLLINTCSNFAINFRRKYMKSLNGG